MVVEIPEGGTTDHYVEAGHKTWGFTNGILQEMATWKNWQCSGGREIGVNQSFGL